MPIVEVKGAILPNGTEVRFKDERLDEVDQGGIVAPVNGFFTLMVDDNGDLWAISAAEGTTPDFEYDAETGALYVVQEID